MSKEEIEKEMSDLRFDIAMEADSVIVACMERRLKELEEQKKNMENKPIGLAGNMLHFFIYADGEVKLFKEVYSPNTYCDKGAVRQQCSDIALAFAAENADAEYKNIQLKLNLNYDTAVSEFSWDSFVANPIRCAVDVVSKLRCGC